MQEVIRCDAPKAVLTYRDEERELPQRTRFFEEVTEALGDHDAFFAPAATGPLWDGEVSYPSYWGVATYVRRGRAVIGQVQGFVHGEYGPDGFGDHPRSRTAQGVRVYHPGLGRAVSVIHMHGLRIAEGKMDTPERETQAHRFLEHAAALAGPDDIRVMCGDFNVEPNSKTLSLIKDAGLTELVAHFGFPGTRSAAYEKPGRWADYMAIDQVDAVRAFDVSYEPVVSDHCPLLLEI